MALVRGLQARTIPYAGERRDSGCQKLRELERALPPARAGSKKLWRGRGLTLPPERDLQVASTCARNWAKQLAAALADCEAAYIVSGRKK